MIDVHDSARVAELHAALGSGPRPDPETLVAGAAEALRRSAHAPAAALLDAAIVLDPQHAPAWAMYGALESARGRPEAARRAYERAMALDDEDLLSAVALCELYARTASREPRDAERAGALANWLLLEPEVPPDIIQRVVALKRALRPGTPR